MKISWHVQYRIILLICSFQRVVGVEYFYPVGTIQHEDKDKLCMILQKKMKLQVWFWDVETKEAVKGLPTFYNAAGLQILPSGKAFSFIHNDVVHIKEIDKRSPVMLDLGGLYDFSRLNWIDDTTCYFSARLHDRMQIFQATIGKNKNEHVTNNDAVDNIQDATAQGLALLAENEDADCLYPQQVGNYGNHLFYIEKHSDGQELIVKKPYIVPLMEEKDVRFLVQDAERKAKKDVLYVHGAADETICFLQMIDYDYGFFLAHKKSISSKSEFLDVKVFQIKEIKIKNSWGVKLIFSFKIPLKLLLGNDRFYESIYPFIPQYYDNSLYFVTYENEVCSAGVFSLARGKVMEKTTLINSVYSSPCRYKNILYYGGLFDSALCLRQIGDEYYIVM